MGFITFLGYHVWGQDDSMRFFYYYIFLFLAYRIIAIPIGAKFVLKNKVNGLMIGSYISVIILALNVLLLTDRIENLYVLLHFYAIPLTFFTTFFQLSSEQMIAQAGNEESFSKFFFLTGMWKNITDFVVPLILGTLIVFTEFKYAFALIIIIALYNINEIRKMDKVDVEFRGQNFRDVFRKTGNKEKRKLSLIHYIFIFTIGMFLQYMDNTFNSYQNIVAPNEFWLGVLKATMVILVFVIYKLKSRNIFPDRYWFYGSLSILGVTMVIETFTSGYIMNVVVLFSYVLLYYTVHSSSKAVSFRMVDKEDNFGKFSMILKREIVRNISKIFITLVGFVVAFDNITDTSYKIYTIGILLTVVIPVVTYKKLDEYARK